MKRAFAISVAVAFGLSGCGVIPMGTGEYLTDDGDGEAAVRELAVRSVEMGAEASGVPGWMLYEREPSVRDCRSMYGTGNFVAYSDFLYHLDKPMDQDVLFGRVSSKIEAEGGFAIVLAVEPDEPDGFRHLKAMKGLVVFGISTSNDDEGLVTDFRISSSSVCVKPDGEIVDDFRSRSRRKFQDAS